jgi:archaellum component FlaD/FlaE
LGFGGSESAQREDDGRSVPREDVRSRSTELGSAFARNGGSRYSEESRRHEEESRRYERGSRRREESHGSRHREDPDPDDVGRFQFDTEIRERPRGRPGEALRENQLEQLLVHETAAAGDGLSKPYLTALPDEYAAERIVFDWLEFLVLKGGFKRTMDAVRYYHTVEWLTEDVEAALQDYLVGFSGEVSNTSEFDVDDHHLSLVYIARLTSMT